MMGKRRHMPSIRGKVGFIIKRIIQLIFTLFILVTILFFMFRILPGDPTTMLIDAALTHEAQQMIMKRFGLDRPLHEQYRVYIDNLLRGELGVSFSYRVPVSKIIGAKVVNTIFLQGCGTLLAIILGIFGGAFLVQFRKTKGEILGIIFPLIFYSTPIFWTGLVFLNIFSYNLGLFPLGGMTTPGQYFENEFYKYFSLDFLHHLILPAVVSALYYMTTPMLIMRTSMIEVMQEDFIEMVRAKGLKEHVILFKHVMRNALLPVITVITTMVGFSFGGQVLLEVVFNWPGMGRELVLAIQRSDYPMAQASFLFMGFMAAMMNFLADILYGYIDPRVIYK